MKPKRKTYWLDMTPEEIRDSWARFGLRYALVILILSALFCLIVSFMRSCGGAT